MRGGSAVREGRLAVCVDFGSTYTKAALIDLHEGRLVARAEHRTTVDTDVMDGWECCRAELVRQAPEAAEAEVLACSSAGGGLRIGVVGNEALVTTEAGRRVALSSGGLVVHVSSPGPGAASDESWVAELAASRPDVVLVAGGTDGGNAEVLLACAAGLARAGWAGPVVVAGNVEARDEVAGLLAEAGTPYVLADNLMPRIGVLAPDSARSAIRAMFLTHVIGGKHLSSSPAFAAMVRAATPDVVLRAVELLGSGLGPDQPGAGDVVVVDVGGATTDVYSVIEQVQDDDEELSREVVATAAANRTVEGDLGMRWSAVPTVEAADAAGLLPDSEAATMQAAAEVRRADPAYLPGDATEAANDLRLASFAAAVALRRHAGETRVRFDAGSGRVVERSGVDLREVRLLVGSGGALRHADQPFGHLARQLLDRAAVPGRQLPERPDVVVDIDYVLAAAGLLAERHPEAALRLLGSFARDRPPHRLTRWSNPA
jgi:uncharacterized protein (TIGR01319 family)